LRRQRRWSDGIRHRSGQPDPKFESAVIGLEPGQSVKVRIAADDAYGQRAEEMVAVIERSEIPADMKPLVGDHLEVIMQDNTPMPVMVTDVRKPRSHWMPTPPGRYGPDL